MALTVQTNTAAITALKHLNANSLSMNKSLERLSSGFRVNNAADDASGFAIASKLDAQAGRLKAASQNAAQAIAMVKMADAGINEIQNMVNRIQTLATQAASSNNAGELAKLDAERLKLEAQIDKIANSTNFNGINLLNGVDNSVTFDSTFTAGATPGSAQTASIVTASGASVNETYTLTSAATGDITVTNAAGTTVGNVTFAAGKSVSVQLSDGATLSVTFKATAAAGADTVAVTNQDVAGVGANTGATYASALAFQVGADNNTNNQVTIDLTKAYTTTALGLGTGDLTTQANAQAYIDTAKAALDKLITQRADLGATQNQLGFVQANLATSIEQSQAAVATIRDADMAAEMANFTKNQILVQAGTAMLAQANQAAQNVLSLFR